MRKFWINTFQTITILLLLFLIVSTFIPQTGEFPPGEYPGSDNGLIRFFHLDQFYDSPINIALWGLLSVITITSVFLKGIRSPIQKIIHILLALCFIVIAIEKSSNQRFNINISEGETVLFTDYSDTKSDKYNVSIKLLKFEILMHPGQRMPKAFTSYLLINDQDTVRLSVNRPYAVGHYRLYQSAYDQEVCFQLAINEQNHSVTFGDTVFIDTSEVILEGFNHQRRVFDLKINGKYYHTGMQQPRRIDGYSVMLSPGETRYTSTIEVAEVRWTKLLLVLSILYVFGLFVAFWRRKPAK